MSEAAIAKKNGWQTGRWGLLTAGVVMLAFLGGIVWPDVFRLSGVNAIAPIFSDLIAILAAGEADQMGRDVFKHNPLDPFNRPHVYGPWWLVVGDLGLVRADARWLIHFWIEGLCLRWTSVHKQKHDRAIFHEARIERFRSEELW